MQRVAAARVDTGGQVVAEIGAGLLVLAGFEEADTDADLVWMAGKLVRLRLFADAAGVMNRSLLDCQGDVLAVSQFTLFASTRKGNRPSWSRAARPDVAQPLFDRFVVHLTNEIRRPVATGIFAAEMQIHLINDGPVTVCIDSRRPE